MMDAVSVMNVDIVAVHKIRTMKIKKVCCNCCSEALEFVGYSNWNYEKQEYEWSVEDSYCSGCDNNYGWKSIIVPEIPLKVMLI